MGGIPYNLMRSNRKTLALIIDDEGQLVVRAPLKLSEEVILEFVRKKTSWIEKKQRQAAEYRATQKVFALANEALILYLGEPYKVILEDCISISFYGNYLSVPEKMTHDAFVEWLKQQAGTVIRQRADYYASKMGVEFSSLRISKARRRWGSCGAKNTLNFTWRLVMCPLAVIDYVVVHELAHITHKDHRSGFWSQVAMYFPDYKQSQSWLKQNCGIIDII